MMSYFKPFALAAISILFVGCAQKTIPDPEPTDTTYGDEAGATTDSMGDDAYGEGEYMDDPSAGELQMVIYFEFDSSEVRAQAAAFSALCRPTRPLSIGPGWRDLFY